MVSGHSVGNTVWSLVQDWIRAQGPHSPITKTINEFDMAISPEAQTQTGQGKSTAISPSLGEGRLCLNDVMWRLVTKDVRYLAQNVYRENCAWDAVVAVIAF